MTFSADKVFNLYNSLFYNNADVDVLKKDIENMINVHSQFTAPMAPTVLLVVMYYQPLES